MRKSGGLIVAAQIFALVVSPPHRVAGQFDAVPVPEAMGALDFMLGDWDVEGAFRNPDHIGADRTLWYSTRGGGVTRFDGRAWTAYRLGDSALADSVMTAIKGRADPYEFSGPMTVYAAQDGFVLIVDEGRTSGTTMIYFDTAASEWVATSLHAASNSLGSSSAPLADEGPVFEGAATDRRGPRIFRRRYEVVHADHFRVRTDVSFDEGVTWIDDQIVQDVRRQR